MSRLLNDPKPFVVSIAWVVESVEKRTRLDEADYTVDLDDMNVAGTNKVCSHRQVFFPGLTMLIYRPAAQIDASEIDFWR